MNSFGEFQLFERLRRRGVASGILFGLFIFDLKRIGVRSFCFEFPVMVDDVIASNPYHPCHERARFRPERMKRPIDFQKNFLSQILGFIKSSGETVSQIVDPLMMLANDVLPGAMVAGQASFHQLRIGLQPSWLRPLLLPRYK